MAKDRDEDGDRNLETQRSIDQRRKRRFELSKEYREVRLKLPNPRKAIEDDPRDLRHSTEPPETRQVFGDVLGGGWSTSDAG